MINVRTVRSYKLSLSEATPMYSVNSARLGSE
jgi:hypothetical protein